MKVISVQPTPNPSAFKFVLDRMLTNEIRNYDAPSEVKGDLLAQALFAVPNVSGLFFCENFVTVTMARGADWRTVKEQVTKVIETTWVDAPKPASAAAKPAAAGAAGSPQDQELMRKIEAVFDDRVRPALAGDGGGLEILGLEGKTLRIRYQGSCGSCPSSIAGTLNAIQNMLQSEIDEELTVVSA
jgi:Fe-S cluster biogenesis protein NfuA